MEEGGEEEVKFVRYRSICHVDRCVGIEPLLASPSGSVLESATHASSPYVALESASRLLETASRLDPLDAESSPSIAIAYTCQAPAVGSANLQLWRNRDVSIQKGRGGKGKSTHSHRSVACCTAGTPCSRRRAS